MDGRCAKYILKIQIFMNGIFFLWCVKKHPKEFIWRGFGINFQAVSFSKDILKKSGIMIVCDTYFLWVLFHELLRNYDVHLHAQN